MVLSRSGKGLFAWRTITRDELGFTYQRSWRPSPSKSPNPYQPAPFQLLLCAHSTSGAKEVPVDKRTITRDELGFTYQRSWRPSPSKSPNPYQPAPFQLLLCAHSTSGAKEVPVDKRTITRDELGFTYQRSWRPSPSKSPNPYQPAPFQLLLCAHSTSGAKEVPVDKRTITRDELGFTYQRSWRPSPSKSPNPYQPAPFQLLLFAHSFEGAKPLTRFCKPNETGIKHPCVVVFPSHSVKVFRRDRLVAVPSS